MYSESTTLSIEPTTITIISIVAACLSILASYKLMKPLPASISEKSTARPFTGLLLLASALSWTLLGMSTDTPSLSTSSSIASTNVTSNNATSSNATSSNIAYLEEIESLPTTAAGIPPSFDAVTLPGTSLSEAKAITAAEEIAEEPQNPDFLTLRNHITQMLFSAEAFKSIDAPIKIDLSHDRHKEMIKYLADERPGLLTIIYHKQMDSGSRMVVYFPEIAGNQLTFTPLTGPASNSLSKAAKQIIKH